MVYRLNARSSHRPAAAKAHPARRDRARRHPVGLAAAGPVLGGWADRRRAAADPGRTQLPQARQPTMQRRYDANRSWWFPGILWRVRVSASFELDGTLDPDG